MRPSEVADRYFEAVRARDLAGLVSLYAHDATLTLPNGRAVEGIEAIEAFQADVNARGAPFPTPGGRIADASGVAVEIEAALPDGTVRRTANFFHLDEAGLIARLNVYSRG